VSVWLDDLSRELLAGGELRSLIADRHVVGVTTNPTIFGPGPGPGRRRRRPTAPGRPGAIARISGEL
jgi:hypothetical protein